MTVRLRNIFHQRRPLTFKRSDGCGAEAGEGGGRRAPNTGHSAGTFINGLLPAASVAGYPSPDEFRAERAAAGDTTRQTATTPPSVRRRVLSRHKCDGWLRRDKDRSLWL